jgi:hypothetical protein
MRQNIRKKKAFTLLETVVTIVIYAAMLLMITNIVLMNARLSQQLKMRSRIRTELSQIVSLVKRDVRNAATINYSNCADTQCEMTIQGNVIIWKYNSSDKKIQKVVNGVSEYITADFVSVDSLNFSVVQDNDLLNRRATVIFTMKASGQKEIWGVSNQVVQEIISTRNYQLGI